ncbi:hypothetical protein B9Q00_08485 [Candidatus Marsarchaeota G1 archaeon OSP_C]|uniref:HEPN domain-containing protein n=1 Tax=Candidatus Marsarchaeota G1 archaeon OSP_C TaxID=1978154 RepID=A0A2R6AMF9_9ARCH|nr:MAG: hypothetical protein B9Q00_08485 [Candidatus Marsarchaeota G1 archaeon OSP_C]
MYDLAAFNLEQHCELLLKYLLFYYEGFYPKTHSLTELIQRLQRVGRIVTRRKLVVHHQTGRRIRQF